MRFHVTRSYLDLARGVIDTRIYGNPDSESSHDAIFALVSCTNLYSFMALTAFVTRQLHELWTAHPSTLKEKHPNHTSFESLMASDLRDLKSALRELANALNIRPPHEVIPREWQQLNEIIKRHRDFFVHPDPEAFNDVMTSSMNEKWEMPSRVAREIIRYFHSASQGTVPEWLDNPSLKCRGFDYVGS